MAVIKPWEVPSAEVAETKTTTPWELEQQFNAIGESGGPAPPEAPEIPLRFRPPPPEGLTLEGFGKNLKQSGQENLGNTMNVGLHPVDTAKNLVSLFTGDGLKSLKDYYIQSYGSVEKARMAAYNDPMGFLSDVSILGSPTRLTGVVGDLPAVERAGVIMQNLDPVTAAGTALTYAPSKYAVENRNSAINPQRAYENKLRLSLSPSNRYSSQSVRDRVTSTLLDNEVPLTPQGIEAFQNTISARTAQLDEMVANADQAGTRIPMSDVLTNLRELRNELSNPLTNPEHAADTAAIGNFVREWLQNIGPVRSLTPSQVRTLRQTLDNKINWNKIDTTTPPTTQRIRESVAHGARNALGEAVDPGGTTARDISDMLTALRPAQKAAAQQRNNNIFSLPALGVGGMAGSGVGKVMDSGNSAVNTVASLTAAVAAAKLMSTDSKLALARAIWNNSELEEAAKRNLIRQLASEGGRVSEIASGEYNYMEPPK